MATTEQAIQAAWQTALRGLSIFEDADVVVNDWNVLDGSIENAPYVVIENSDDWDSVWDMSGVKNNYRLPFTLAVKLASDTWKTALDNFRDVRQDIIDLANTGANRTLTALNLDIETVRPDGPVGYIYPGDVEPSNYVTPLFVSQRMVLDVKEL